MYLLHLMFNIYFYIYINSVCIKRNKIISFHIIQFLPPLLFFAFFCFKLTYCPAVPDTAPTSLTTTTYGAFLILFEWQGIPRAAMNGCPLGYKITTYLKGKVVQDASTDFLDSFYLVENLYPGSQYMFEVCAYNSLGIGPCDRTTGFTLDSRRVVLREL